MSLDGFECISKSFSLFRENPLQIHKGSEQGSISLKKLKGSLEVLEESYRISNGSNEF